MKIKGSVVAILNAEEIIIKSNNEELTLGEELHVVAQQTIPALSSKIGRETVFIPKGSVSIMWDQGDNLYLAKCIRATIKREKTITVDSSLFARNFMASFLPRQETIVEEVPGDVSAVTDEKQRLNINFIRKIQEGDFIV